MINEAPLHWLVATVSRFREEAEAVRTIAFDVPGWRGHLAGQHVDIRLTAEDGYVAQRSYSIASAAGPEEGVELTVERVGNGEVSPFLLDELRVGDTIELRGPIGGYFTWMAGRTEPLMMFAGGSGIAPLMSMLRTRATASCRGPVRLLYSSRSERHIIYRDELDRLHKTPDGLILTHTLTRDVPEGWTGEHGRIGPAMLKRHGLAPGDLPVSFICGPTPFVEAVANHLVELGYETSSIKTERFGPTGGGQ